MSGAMAATTTDHHKWMMQLYEQPQMDCDGSNMAPPIMEAFSDATVVTTMSPESSSMMMLSQISNSSCSSSISNVQLLSPKRNNNNNNNNNNSAFKPIRKRSRASRRTPTTLLNANTNNFRELVQKFTGCGSTHMSLSIHKGPITLNFQQGSNNNDNNHKMILHHYHHHQQQQQQQNSTTTSGTVSPFGTRTSNYYFYNQQAHEHHDVAAVMPSSQEQQSGGAGLISTSLDSNLPSYDVDYLSSSRPTSMDASEDGLHQLTVNDFSNNGIKGSGFFM